MTQPRARIIDGRALATQVKESLRRRVADLGRLGRAVRLDTILVGGDGAAAIYAANQARACQDLGIHHRLHELPAADDHQRVASCVSRLNADPGVSAIMVHLPLPPAVDTERIQSLIDPAKDVEGVNPANIGNVVYGRRSLVPCTALAVMEMIESTGIALRGRRCACVGASTLVGKPVAVLLMRAEATVISTNVHTVRQDELTRTCDVLVAAAGVPGLIRAAMVKPGAVVIDVGINRVAGPDGGMRTVGDVSFEEVAGVAGAISPVPGGVGPMTVAMLLRNTVEAAERASG
jgi:methylenetetrahydrofolate dehydrogenase (NADP+)/methenyltetrahydrofolate cyclohydrolase